MQDIYSWLLGESHLLVIWIYLIIFEIISQEQAREAMSMRHFSETRSRHQPLPHLRLHLEASSQLVSIQPLVTLPWMNSDLSGRKLRKTTKMMRSSYLKLILIELKMPPISKQRINFSRKKDWLTNKRLQPLQNQKPRRKRWLKWTRLELKKCNQLSNRSIQCPKMRPSFLKLKKCLTMSSMMSNKWIRWYFIQKLSQSEINSLKKIRDLNLNGLKNKRSLILWWKLKDSKFFKKKRKERFAKLKLENKVPKLS